MMVGKIKELSARDSWTGISASRDDDDSNDDGHLSASLFVGEKLKGICFSRLRKSGFRPVHMLGKRFKNTMALNAAWQSRFR
jgi:hypothetical protein